MKVLFSADFDALVPLDRFHSSCRVPHDSRRHPDPQCGLVWVHQLQGRSSKTSPEAQQEQAKVIYQTKDDANVLFWTKNRSNDLAQICLTLWISTDVLNIRACQIWKTT